MNSKRKVLGTGKQILAILTVLLILTSTVSVVASAQDPADKDSKKEKKAEVDPENFIVKYTDKKDHELVKVSKGETLESAMEKYKHKSGVKYIEPNFIYYTMNTPNDPGFSTLWAMNNIGQTGGTPGVDIGAPRAWDLTTGSSNVVVAVIDTGVDYNHPELAANIWINPGEIANNGIDDDGNGFIDDIHGIDTYNNDADPMDDHNHGTHVSGTIGAIGNNSNGVAGVNWNVRIMPVKFLGAGGSGSTDGAIRAIDYAMKNGAKIMSNSWGGGGYSQALADKINEAIVNYNVSFIAAAGNSAGNNDISPAYPANYPGVIAVAAIDHNGQLASFSNYGVNKVSLGAPGVNINSTVRNGGYAIYSGTSMATPHVAGVEALIKAQYPVASREEIEARLLGGTAPIAALAGKTKTGGMLNAYNPLETDNIAPAQIIDLAARSITMDSVALAWTASGDDGSVGKSSNYDLRYSTKPITELSWPEAIQVSGEPIPQLVGTSETFTVTGLETNTTYYFAIKAIDNVGNPSEISNVVSVTTPNPFIVFNDDMENGTNGWNHSGILDSWSLTTPFYGPSPHSGTKVWISGYSNLMNSRLISPSFSLENIVSGKLVLWHYYATELNWDGSIDTISTDGGNTWTQITPTGGYPGILYSANPLGAVPAFTGSSGIGWYKVTYDLSAYSGQRDVRFASVFATDGSVSNYAGRFIDDETVYGTQILSPPPPPPPPPPPQNYPPLALNQNLNIDEDNSVNIVLSGYDSNGDALTFFMDAYPQYGFITLDQDFIHNGKLTYMPYKNYNGMDAFTFRVNDGVVDSLPGIVEININPVNDRPIANAQSVILDEDTSKNIVLTGTDVEGSPLIFSIAGNPTNGTLELDANFSNNGRLIYLPRADFYGNDSISFTVNDSELVSGQATVEITVNPMPEECWNGSNKYLVNNKNQAKKFAKCASGTYGYGSVVTERSGIKYTAYQYKDFNDTANWSVEMVISANRPIKSVTVNGRTYLTNQSYVR